MTQWYFRNPRCVHVFDAEQSLIDFFKTHDVRKDTLDAAVLAIIRTRIGCGLAIEEESERLIASKLVLLGIPLTHCADSTKDWQAFRASTLMMTDDLAGVCLRTTSTPMFLDPVGSPMTSGMSAQSYGTNHTGRYFWADAYTRNCDSGSSQTTVDSSGRDCHH